MILCTSAKSEVWDVTFFETDIECKTVALSKPETEARLRQWFLSSFLGHFEEKSRNSSDILLFSRPISRMRPDFDLAWDRCETEARNSYWFHVHFEVNVRPSQTSVWSIQEILGSLTEKNISIEHFSKWIKPVGNLRVTSEENIKVQVIIPIQTS